jgi:hypothetical protein
MSVFNDETNDTSPYDLGVTDGYALLLDGNMAITNDTNDVTGFNDDLYLAQASTDRFLQIKLLDPLYYIKTAFDINSKVNMYPGNDAGNDGIDGENDDTWTLDAFTVNKGTAGATTYKLPIGEIGGVNITKIQATDDSGLRDTFSLDFNLALDDQGDITITNYANAWSGNPIAGVINDDILAAQTAYWTNDTTAEIVGGAVQNPVGGAAASAPNENDMDTLLAVLTKEELATHYANDVDTAVSMFNDVNVVADWTITIDAVGNDTKSNLSAYARNKFSAVDGTPNDSPFVDGDQIVAADPKSYRVALVDNLNETKVLVAGTNVYGVVYQSQA